MFDIIKVVLRATADVIKVIGENQRKNIPPIDINREAEKKRNNRRSNRRKITEMFRKKGGEIMPSTSYVMRADDAFQCYDRRNRFDFTLRR